MLSVNVPPVANAKDKDIILDYGVNNAVIPYAAPAQARKLPLQHRIRISFASKILFEPIEDTAHFRFIQPRQIASD